MTMPESLLSPTFLFRFSTTCRRAASVWPNRGAVDLDANYSLPSFGELEGRRKFADFRMAWCDEGLGLTLQVNGKTQACWCRDTRVEDSDGLSVWVDTRDAHNIHRASRFCHRFVLLPFGAGNKADQP